MIPVGNECYHETNGSIHAFGREWSEADLNAALNSEVSAAVYDCEGNKGIQSMLKLVETTDFENGELEKVLSCSDKLKPWQVGEAIAGCYLEKHRNCCFPWPNSRDVRRPGSSLPGADLVGFITEDDNTRFAFGEVKTSEQEMWPPQVCRGRSGTHSLGAQIEDLCLQDRIKIYIFRYLGHRVELSTERSRNVAIQFRNAATRFLNNHNDVYVVGFLVRDVEPKAADFSVLLTRISKIKPSTTTVELFALYLPKGRICTLAKTIERVRKDGAA